MNRRSVLKKSAILVILLSFLSAICVGSDSEKKSPRRLAMDDSFDHKVGVTVYVTMSQTYADALSQRGLSFDGYGQMVKTAFDEYGIETRTGFWDINDGQHTFVIFFVRGILLPDPITGDKIHTVQDALTMGSSIRLMLEELGLPLSSTKEEANY